MEFGRRKLQVNPCQSAGWLSKIFFAWTIPIFKRTYDNPIDANDASEPLIIDRSSVLGDRIERFELIN